MFCFVFGWWWSLAAVKKAIAALMEFQFEQMRPTGNIEIGIKWRITKRAFSLHKKAWHFLPNNIYKYNYFIIQKSPFETPWIVDIFFCLYRKACKASSSKRIHSYNIELCLKGIGIFFCRTLIVHNPYKNERKKLLSLICKKLECWSVKFQLPCRALISSQNPCMKPPSLTQSLTYSTLAFCMLLLYSPYMLISSTIPIFNLNSDAMHTEWKNCESCGKRVI